MSCLAFGDESMRAPRDGAPGVYVLAAAILNEDDADAMREDVRALGPRGGLAFHWRLEQEPRRAKAVAMVASLPALHIVVIGAPLTPSKQERCRRMCLASLLAELEQADVSEVKLESRRPHDNLRDLDAVAAFRRQKTISKQIRVDHEFPAGPRGEPLLWLPDIVAGVITSGATEHREALDSVLFEVRIAFD